MNNPINKLPNIDVDIDRETLGEGPKNSPEQAIKILEKAIKDGLFKID